MRFVVKTWVAAAANGAEVADRPKIGVDTVISDLDDIYSRRNQL